MSLNGLCPERDFTVRSPKEYSNIEVVGAAVEAARLVGIVGEHDLEEFSESVKQDYIKICENTPGRLVIIQPNLDGVNLSLRQMATVLDRCSFPSDKDYKKTDLSGLLWNDYQRYGSFPSQVINRLGRLEEYNSHVRVIPEVKGGALDVMFSGYLFDSLHSMAGDKTQKDMFIEFKTSIEKNISGINVEALNPGGVAMAALVRRIMGRKIQPHEVVRFIDQDRRRAGIFLARQVIGVAYHSGDMGLLYDSQLGRYDEEGGIVATYGLNESSIR